MKLIIAAILFLLSFPFSLSAFAGSDTNGISDYAGGEGPVNSGWKDAENTIREWTIQGFGSSDYFYGLLVYPMDLNSAREEYLSSLPCFGTAGAKKIVCYRRGREIRALMELTNAGLCADDLLKASPFITVKPSADKGVVLRSDVVFRSEEKTYANSLPELENESSHEMEFRASLEIKPARLYFAASSTNFAPDWTEWGRRPRFFVILQGDNLRFIAGHYQLAIGQNLLFGPAFSPPVPGFEGRPAKKSDRGLSPCTSLSTDPDGNGIRDVFEGLAVSFEFRGMEISGFDLSPRIISFVSRYGAYPDAGITNQTDYGADVRISLPFENSTAGFTAAKQERADGKYNDVGLSVHYDASPAGWFRMYGEAAGFTGMGAVQGFDFRFGAFSFSVLGFYADTNFNAPNASDILHAHKDALGFFTGAGFAYEGLDLSAYGDLQWKLSDTNDVRQRYELAAKMTWKGLFGGDNRFAPEARCRYSDTSDGRGLRSTAGLEAVFFKDRIKLEIRWQNFLGITCGETGNLLSLRAWFAPLGNLSVVLRWNTYGSKSYASSLFDTREAAYAGDFQVSPYYGTGNEWTAAVKWKAADGFELNGSFRTDSRETGAGGLRTGSGLTFYLSAAL